MYTLSTSPTHRYIIRALVPPPEKKGSVTPMTGSTAKVHAQVDDYLPGHGRKHTGADVSTQFVLAAQTGGQGFDRNGKQRPQHQHTAHKPNGFGNVAEDEVVLGLWHVVVVLIEQPTPENAPCADGDQPLVLLQGNVRIGGVVHMKQRHNALILVVLEDLILKEAHGHRQRGDAGLTAPAMYRQESPATNIIMQPMQANTMAVPSSP